MSPSTPLEFFHPLKDPNPLKKSTSSSPANWKVLDMPDTASWSIKSAWSLLQLPTEVNHSPNATWNSKKNNNFGLILQFILLYEIEINEFLEKRESGENKIELGGLITAQYYWANVIDLGRFHTNVCYCAIFRYPNYLEAVEAHKEIVEEDGITVNG